MLYKLWIPIILVSLLLQSCGTEEVDELVQKQNYRYVEIEECTIPIPKSFNELEVGKKELYRFIDDTNIKNYRSIDILINKKDDYENSKNFIMQNKSIHLESDFYRDDFRIIKWSKIDSIYDAEHYKLFGLKTRINLTSSNETELNYLLNYCKKTWKLDKGNN